METITWKEYLQYLLENTPYRSEQESLKKQIKIMEEKEKEEQEKK